MKSHSLTVRQTRSHPILSLLALAGALLLGSSAFTAIPSTNADPTGLEVRLFRTELHNGSAWVTVFDNSAGVAVDLVTNPGAAFGTGTIAVGTYNTIRFTLENTLRYSGTSGSCPPAVDASLLIDNAAGAAAPVMLFFATASATPPGGTSWYSNGSDANPFLMTGAVQVESGMTTNVNLQFNTQNTLECDGVNLTLNPPTMNVASRVVGAAAFAGGDYWLTHFNVQRSPLRDAGGAVRDPRTTYTDTDWATVRGRTGYYLGWGAKITFSPPDTSGSGTATIVTDMTEHRHRVDETGGCADCGVNPSGVTGMVLTYTLSASNELTLSIPGGGTARGAFSRDYNTLIAADTDGADAGQDLVMGVKVSTAAPTMSGLYAWNGYGVDLDYVTAPAPSPAAARVHVGAEQGWIDLITGGDGLGYNGYLDISDPTLTTASGHTATGNGVMAAVPAIVPAANGIYTDPTNGGFWLAVSPDGQVALVASGINDTDPSRTYSDAAGNTYARHGVGYTLALKQDPLRTYTAADVAGTYILAARWDDAQITTPGVIGGPIPPNPNACRTFPDDISGSAACGTGVQPRMGSSYGRFTLSSAGTVSFDITETNDLGEVSSLTGTAGFTVRKECIGLNGTGGRLPFTDTTCTNGQRLDMVVLNDGMRDFAKFLIGGIGPTSGDVLTFFDPRSIDPTFPSVGKGRSLGNAVRLR